MKMQFILAASDPLEHVLPHALFPNSHYFGWFTNQSAMILLACVLMLLIFPTLFGRVDTSPPSGVKNFFEFVLEFLRNDVFRPCLKENTDAFLPFLWTLFFYILFCNVLGLLPLAAIIGLLTGGRIEHMGGAATGSIHTTATLAICAFFFIHFQGLAILTRSLKNGTYGQHHHHENDKLSHGMMSADKTQYFEYPHRAEKMSAAQAFLYAVPLYLWNFAPHPFKESGLIADVATWSFLLLMELIGAVIKPFALCMRLFGNMVSGHLVLAVLISLIVSAPTILGQITVGVPIVVLDLLIALLEVLVAFLHAYIFAFLTALFIAGAVAPEH
jgi:F-type H+-transporting ATPase subunit a